MIDDIFFWTGLIVWALAGLTLAAGGSLIFVEFVLKKAGMAMKIVLILAQRNAEMSAIERGDASDVAWAKELVDMRVSEARKRRGLPSIGKARR